MNDASFELPPAPVALPPAGPPAISPRAQRALRRLGIPIQALAIPVPGKRITEREVLAAAHIRGGLRMTAAARRAAAARGTLGIELPRAPAFAGRLKAADIEKLPPIALRLPAERVRMTPEQLERLALLSRANQHVPLIKVSAFLPAGPLLQRGEDATGIAAFFVRAIGRILADERLREFRAILDGPDRVYRGQLNVGYTRYAPLSANTAAGSVERTGTTFYNVDRLGQAEVAAAMSGCSDGARMPGALVSFHDMTRLGIESLEVNLEPGESAAIALGGLQIRPTQKGPVNTEWVAEKGWVLFVTADARVLNPGHVGIFTELLKYFLEIPTILL